MLRGAGLLNEAHAAVNLDAERGDLAADIRAEGLGDRGQEPGEGVIALALGFVRRMIEEIDRPRRRETDRAGCRGHAFHGHEHAAHVRMLDDCRHAVYARAPALFAFLGEGMRLLKRAFGDRHTLHADMDPGVVHHREHAGEAPVFLADEPARGAARLAIGHDAGRAAVNPEFLLDADAFDVVAFAERTVLVDQEFRHQEQRNALGAGRRIRQTRQHQMDDVFGQVVFAVG